MSTPPPEHVHPGFDWLQDSACSKLPKQQARQYFVAAGQMLPDPLRDLCRQDCPVRRQCVLHAYLGGPNGTRITGPGHFAALSARQRSEMSLCEALAFIETDRPSGVQGVLL